MRAGPVNLVRANVDEAPRPMPGPVGGSQKDSGPIHIDVLEGGWVLERRLCRRQGKKAVMMGGRNQQRPNVILVQPQLTDVSLGSEMKDVIDVFCVEDVIYQS